MMEIDTHNINLKHRLIAFAKAYPELCRIVADDVSGCMSFQIDKRRCSLRLTQPYSDERKFALSTQAKSDGIHTRVLPIQKMISESRIIGSATTTEFFEDPSYYSILLSELCDSVFS